jgi:hypothetical protein
MLSQRVTKNYSGWSRGIYTSTHNSSPPHATGPIKVVLDKCLVQQNVIQVHITPVLQMSRGIWGTGVMCTCITFCWTRYLFNSIWRIGVMCTCITFCWVSGAAECNTSTHNSSPPHATGPIKVVLDKCLVQQNVIQVHITPVPHMPRDQSK